MPDESQNNPGLWPEERKKAFIGEQEETIREFVAALRQKAPLTSRQNALAATCLSLARNIDSGNGKGRAIANETAQLIATLDLLDPPALSDPETKDYPEDVRLLLEAFGGLPRPSSTTESHTSQL